MSDRLILEIEVPDFNVQGALEESDDMTVFDVVVEEWMKREVGLTFVTLPDEKSMNHEFDVHTRTCRIVGARIAQKDV